MVDKTSSQTNPAQQSNHGGGIPNPSVVAEGIAKDMMGRVAEEYAAINADLRKAHASNNQARLENLIDMQMRLTTAIADIMREMAIASAMNKALLAEENGSVIKIGDSVDENQLKNVPNSEDLLLETGTDPARSNPAISDIVRGSISTITDNDLLACPITPSTPTQRSMRRKNTVAAAVAFFALACYRPRNANISSRHHIINPNEGR